MTEPNHTASDESASGDSASDDSANQNPKAKTQSQRFALGRRRVLETGSVL